MLVINNFEANRTYPEETLRTCNWERFEKITKDCYFFNAHPHGITDIKYSDKEKILLYFEEQLVEEYRNDSIAKYADRWFTVLNPEISGRYGNRESVFYPTNENIINKIKHNDKKYDVIYTGNLYRGDHVELIANTITNFNYRLLSFENSPIVTNSGGTYLSKLQLVADSKIDVCHGLVGNGTPQTKSRYFEAAFCKSLILIYKDKWNCIEEWFVPDKEFLYWENQSDLYDIIKDVSLNYDKYLSIINNAYFKAINEYTTHHFIKKYIGLLGEK